jgi:hypothetical protein
MLPQFLYRDDDGQEFTLNEDGTYSFPGGFHKHDYAHLIKCGFKESLSECSLILKIREVNCGDDGDD